MSSADDIGRTIAESCAVARADHDRAARELVLSEAALVDQAVERLLHLVRAGVQLVEEQAIGRVAGDHRRRTEPALAVDDLRDSDQVLRRELAAEQRHAR
nr:hypothetical protein [Nannocystis sp. SCPEA4]